MIKKFMAFIRMHYYCKELYHQVILLTIFKPDLSNDGPDDGLLLAFYQSLIDKIKGNRTYYAKHNRGN